MQTLHRINCAFWRRAHPNGHRINSNWLHDLVKYSVEMKEIERLLAGILR